MEMISRNRLKIIERWLLHLDRGRYNEEESLGDGFLRMGGLKIDFKVETMLWSLGMSWGRVWDGV